MRNLKKILALALALIMSLSLVTTAGAFSDDGSITADYSNAVKALNELKVFQGYSDGEFKPQNNITRAEVAAIIYRIATADTADTQKDIYSTYGQFNDVRDGDWYAGYVNYCANAGYIKGRGNKTFDPQASVTGYEALAMILRAVGYDKNGEFTGSNWQIRTASTGKERSITKNIKDTQLGQAATREVVAEILFRAILVPKVDFSANTLSYTVKGAKETIGYQKFKLEEITGVVTGNEFADLEKDVALRAGKTRMVVDGSDYIVDAASGVDDLGEERTAYITNANTTSAKVIIDLEDTGKNVRYETLEKKGIGSDSDFRNVTGLQRSATDTQQFLNFGPVQEWKSDWRVKYVVRIGEYPYDKLSDVAQYGAAYTVKNLNAYIRLFNAVKDFNLPVFGGNDSDIVTLPDNGYTLEGGILVYTKEFKINDVIGQADRTNIKEIFNTADKKEVIGFIRGEVYVGTTSEKDISDQISYAQFVEQYINNTEGKISDNEYGNWLKVIDNDNDGQADYVFKIVYTMAQVVRAKDGKYGLDTQNKNLDDKNGEDVNEITRDDAVSDDTLALGDIVYYAFIDDVIRAYKSEMVSVKVDTVNRRDKKISTSDGKEYLESGVCGKEVVSNEYNCEVVNLNGSATYDIFLDRGGYLALFTDSNAGDFKLIVDGWYNQTKAGVEYAAYVYNDDTGRQDVVDITRGGDLFISNGVSGVYGQHIQNNDWDALKWLGGVKAYANDGVTKLGALTSAGADLNGSGKQVKTTVATLTGDGVILPVDYASNSNTGRTVRMVVPADHKTIPTSAATYDAKVYTTSALSATDTAYDNGDENNDRVQDTTELRALSSTVYYVVYPQSRNESGFAVERYVGYNNVPKIDKDSIEDVYAVATRQSRVSTLGESTYYTANVVVVELNTQYKGFAEQVFIYDLSLANTGVTIEEVGLIREDGSKETVRVDFAASQVRDYRWADLAGTSTVNGTWGPGLYYLYATNTEGLYTVKAMTADEIAENNYAVGWAGTALNTLGADYVSVVMFDDTDVGNGSAVGSWKNSGIAYGMAEKSAANGHIYTLKYDRNGIADLGEYEASAGNIQKFLGERADETNEVKTDYEHVSVGGGNFATSWNQNRVLIHYSGNGVRYAVSFANNNIARNVWIASRPSSAVWTGEKVSRANVMDYAEFMLNGHTMSDAWNIDGNVEATMVMALWNNQNRLGNNNGSGTDTEIKALIGRLLNDMYSRAVKAAAETGETRTANEIFEAYVNEGIVRYYHVRATEIPSVSQRKDAADAMRYATGVAAAADEVVKAVVEKLDPTTPPVVEPEKVTVTFNTGANATVTLKDETEAKTSVEVEKDTDVVFTVAVTDAEKYELVSVKVEGETEALVADTDGNYTVKADAAKTVVVEVKEIKQTENETATLDIAYIWDEDALEDHKTVENVEVVVDAASETRVITLTDEMLRPGALMNGMRYDYTNVSFNGETCEKDEEGNWVVTNKGTFGTESVAITVTFKVVGGNWDIEEAARRARAGEDGTNLIGTFYVKRGLTLDLENVKADQKRPADLEFVLETLTLISKDTDPMWVWTVKAHTGEVITKEDIAAGKVAAIIDEIPYEGGGDETDWTDLDDAISAANEAAEALNNLGDDADEATVEAAVEAGRNALAELNAQIEAYAEDLAENEEKAAEAQNAADALETAINAVTGGGDETDWTALDDAIDAAVEATGALGELNEDSTDEEKAEAIDAGDAALAALQALIDGDYAELLADEANAEKAAAAQDAVDNLTAALDEARGEEPRTVTVKLKLMNADNAKITTAIEVNDKKVTAKVDDVVTIEEVTVTDGKIIVKGTTSDTTAAAKYVIAEKTTGSTGSQDDIWGTAAGSDKTFELELGVPADAEEVGYTLYTTDGTLQAKKVFAMGASAVKVSFNDLRGSIGTGNLYANAIDLSSASAIDKQQGFDFLGSLLTANAAEEVSFDTVYLEGSTVPKVASEISLAVANDVTKLTGKVGEQAITLIIASDVNVITVEYNGDVKEYTKDDTVVLEGLKGKYFSVSDTAGNVYKVDTDKKLVSGTAGDVTSVPANGTIELTFGTPFATGSKTLVVTDNMYSYVTDTENRSTSTKYAEAGSLVSKDGFSMKGSWTKVEEDVNSGARYFGVDGSVLTDDTAFSNKNGTKDIDGFVMPESNVVVTTNLVKITTSAYDDVDENWKKEAKTQYIVKLDGLTELPDSGEGLNLLVTLSDGSQNVYDPKSGGTTWQDKDGSEITTGLDLTEGATVVLTDSLIKYRVNSTDEDDIKYSTTGGIPVSSLGIGEKEYVTVQGADSKMLKWENGALTVSEVTTVATVTDANLISYEQLKTLEDSKSFGNEKLDETVTYDITTGFFELTVDGTELGNVKAPSDSEIEIATGLDDYTALESEDAETNKITVDFETLKTGVVKCWVKEGKVKVSVTNGYAVDMKQGNWEITLVGDEASGDVSYRTLNVLADTDVLVELFNFENKKA